eukprot:1183270-Prorocentrum_minimum.AAC.3
MLSALARLVPTPVICSLPSRDRFRHAPERMHNSLRTPSRPPPDPLLTPRAGLGLVQGTSTLHTEFAPGNPGCSPRW